MNEINTNTAVENTNTETSIETNTPPAAQTPAPTAPAKPTVTMADVVKAELQMAERLVRLKYPHLSIIEGSMTQEPNHPVYGNKRRVQVRCPICGTPVERATSDLHTFIACAVCIKGVRKANKDKKKVEALEALAAALAGK